LPPRPKPNEVNPEDQEEEGLQRMSVLQSVPRLGKGAKQVAENEHNTEHQDAFINPASHSPRQARSLQLRRHR
jgi:hypothetical protein